MSVQQASKRRGFPPILISFEEPAFRWIWGSLVAANSARYGIILVAGWQAFQVSASSLWPSVVFAATLGPTLLIGPLAGSLADRFNRGLVMTAGMSLGALSCLVAAILAFAGQWGLWAVILTTILAGAGNAIQGPAWQALVPGILGPARLLNGGALTRIALQGAQFGGPALGTVLLAAYGPGAALLWCTALYTAAAGQAFIVSRRIPGRVPGTHRGLFAPIVAGLGYVRESRQLTILMILVGLHCCLTMAYTGLLPGLAANHLGGESETYGMLLTAVGLGAITGLLFLAGLGRRLNQYWVLLGSGVVSGLSLAGMGALHVLPLALMLAFLVGASQSVYMAVTYSLIQGNTVAAMRGRVASFETFLAGGSMSLASLGWGALTGVMPLTLIVVAPSLGFVALLLLVWYGAPGGRPHQPAVQPA